MKIDPTPILVAEDEENDALILRLAFNRAQLAMPLVIVTDGQEVVDYLMDSGSSPDRAGRPLPALLLLDLKMPRMTGFDVLKWLSTRSEFKDVPVVILSSSSDDSDRNRASEAGARDYFVKPHKLSELVEIVRALHARYIAEAPSTSGSGH